MTFMLINYAGLTPTRSEEIAFEMMARAHPHETYDTFPERFLAFVKKEAPDLTKDDVERILAETLAAHEESNK